MINLILNVSLIIWLISVAVTIYRLVDGPSSSERIQALDALGVYLIAGVAIVSVMMHTTAFFELILLIGILSFIGTVALARYIERGVVIERD